MNGEKMSNGRVFIEVPVSENAFDLLRLMQMQGEHVTATAARILEDSLQADSGIEATAEGAEPSLDSLLARRMNCMQEAFELLVRLPKVHAELLANALGEWASQWKRENLGAD